MSRIGRKIRELREERNWNQQKLGEELSRVLCKSKPLSSAAISRYEEGKRSVKADLLDAFARVFGVSSAEFYRDGAQTAEPAGAYQPGPNSLRLPILVKPPLSLEGIRDEEMIGMAEFPRFLYPGARCIVQVADSSVESITAGDYCVVASVPDAFDEAILLLDMTGGGVVQRVKMREGGLVPAAGGDPLDRVKTPVVGRVIGVLKRGL